jgi:hypothetical protein
MYKEKTTPKMEEVVEGEFKKYFPLRRDVQKLLNVISEMTPEEMEDIKKRHEQAMGVYPPGFRHFESYEYYRLKFPERSQNDYITESKFLFSDFSVNTPIAFDQYKKLTRNYMRETRDKEH